jgi:C4-dicarboxylate-specific signal transduction histidine kinase
MLYAVHETSAVTATAFANRHQPNLRPDIAAEAPMCDSEHRRQDSQTELAHANRVAILGQLLPSIAHEINEPISAVIINAQAALRVLSVQPTNIEAIRQALARIACDGMRAGDIVSRTSALIEKTPSRRESLDINAAILEAVGVTHCELVMNGVSVQTKLAEDLPLVQGDRVQLQQVMLNLIINAVEPMSPHATGARDLLIRTAKTRSGGLLVAVQDRAPGMDPADLEHIFDPFSSAKAEGLGMGLSVCRAIIQAHGGRLSATRRASRGTILQFTLPAGTGSAS